MAAGDNMRRKAPATLLLLVVALLWAVPPSPSMVVVDSLSLSSAAPTSSHKSSRHPAPKKKKKLVVVGGGIGGLSTAFDATHLLDNKDCNVEVTVVSDRPNFQFTPSNPWVAFGLRQPEDISLPLQDILPRRGINYIKGRVEEILPRENRLRLLQQDAEEEGDTATGNTISTVDYDYLVVATGPRLAFEQVPGLAEHGVSVCTTHHALKAKEAYHQLLKSPGPVVVGATQGASCFGPAYEYALLLHHMLQKKDGNLLERCPITFLTSEPRIGHLGIDGAGESTKILEDLFRKNGIEGVANCRIVNVDKDGVTYEQVSEDGQVAEKKTVPSKLTMLIPPFHGHDVWKNCDGLTHGGESGTGMIDVDVHQQSKSFKNIFGVGICAYLPPQEITQVPTGVPKTGYMIESMGTAAVKNIRTLIKAKEDFSLEKDNCGGALHVHPQMNGLCITDFGDEGAIFLTLPQLPPRRVDVTIQGKIPKLAKIAFEKYFLHKLESGDVDPYYEKYMLMLIGVERTEED